MCANVCTTTPAKHQQSISLYLGGMNIHKDTHVHTLMHVHRTLKRNLRDVCVWLLSCLTTSSQVKNLVNNSLYLPAPLFKTYNVCIAAQVNE